MGEHWQADLSGPTELGRIVAAAKDHNDPAATEQLCLMIKRFAAGSLDLAAHPALGSHATVIAAVPSNPTTADHLVHHLAESVGASLGVAADREILVRRNSTARLRDTDPSQRSRLAADAGYEVTRPLEGAAVVLVDDVIMTGTTVGHVSKLLFEAGASRVDVVIASRTRRRG